MCIHPCAWDCFASCKSEQIKSDGDQMCVSVVGICVCVWGGGGRSLRASCIDMCVCVGGGGGRGGGRCVCMCIGMFACVCVYVVPVTHNGHTTENHKVQTIYKCAF